MTAPLPRSLIQEEYIEHRLIDCGLAMLGEAHIATKAVARCHVDGYILIYCNGWWDHDHQVVAGESSRSKGTGGAEPTNGNWPKRDLAQTGRGGESWKPRPEEDLLSRDWMGRDGRGKMASGRCWRTNGSALI